MRQPNLHDADIKAAYEQAADRGGLSCFAKLARHARRLRVRYDRLVTETRYAVNGGVSIAWQVEGAGPLDVIVVPGIVSHLDAFRELPGYSHFLRSLGAFARVITFDKRGNGLSDRVTEPPSLEERMDDVRAVLDAAGSRRAIVLGISEGGPMSVLFARAHPKRTHALVLFGAFARMIAAPGYEAGVPRASYEAFTARTVEYWGTGGPLVGIFGPSLEKKPDIHAVAARCEQVSATPTALRGLWRMNASIDVRDAAATVTVPTLVMHRRGDRVIPVAASQWLAAHIPRAELVMLDGDDHFPFAGEADRVVAEIRRFTASAAVQTVEAPLSSAVARTEIDVSKLASLAKVDAPLEIGRFVVERTLGAGGMGTVFLARDRGLSRRVAIKVLRAPGNDAFVRFRREAIATARLTHRNVVAIHELGVHAQAPYIVMEYLQGGPASQLGAIDWRRACTIVAAAARGLGAAHALGIVHRDVKPENLLLVSSDGDEVKVADFGIAKLGGADALTRSGAIVGTIGYLAPEQARGEAVDARCDVYALGVTLYRFVTGRAPFEGTLAELLVTAARPLPDPRAHAPDVPERVVDLIHVLSAVDARDRPADGEAADDAIRSVLASPLR